MSNLHADAPTVHLYFDAFTHYVAADWCRVAVLAFALVLAVLVGYNAVLRWGQQRRSASVYLVGLVVALLTFAAAGVIALGRPPIWWFIGLELFVEAVAAVAFLLAVQEARRGMWAR